MHENEIVQSLKKCVDVPLAILSMIAEYVTKSSRQFTVLSDIVESTSMGQQYRQILSKDNDMLKVDFLNNIVEYACNDRTLKHVEMQILFKKHILEDVCSLIVEYSLGEKCARKECDKVIDIWRTNDYFFDKRYDRYICGICDKSPTQCDCLRTTDSIELCSSCFVNLCDNCEQSQCSNCTAKVCMHCTNNCETCGKHFCCYCLNDLVFKCHLC